MTQDVTAIVDLRRNDVQCPEFTGNSTWALHVFVLYTGICCGILIGNSKPATKRRACAHGTSTIKNRCSW